VPHYLGSGGVLSTAPPDAANGSATYMSDPRHPVPTLGGNMTRNENILWPGAYDQRERPDFFLCEPPYLPLAARPDVLVYRTAPLSEELEITGTVIARLWVSSSAPDTDFTVKLVDEYPRNEDYPLGFAMNVTHGIIRCRYRNSRTRAERMEPGAIYPVEIVCYPTSNRFQVGHRIRLDIASSNYPHFDVNTNTGDPFGASQRTIVAENTVYHDRAHPSQVVLPIVR
jgi:putative CocE/NonD family hydrolase